MILITGATGKVGSELVKRLPARSEKVRAFVRDRRHKNPPPGVEFVEGNFSDTRTFSEALVGVDRLFLLIPSSAEVEAQQKAFVNVAKQRDVRHIVYLSQLGAAEDSAGRFQRYHGAVEEYIRDSGIPFTFLRPNLFMQALLNFRSTIASQGAFFTPAGGAKVSLIDVRDIAAVAERTLTEEGHQGKVYDLTGPRALTHDEIADHLSKALGKPIRHVAITSEIMRETLLGFGLPPWQVDGVLEDYDQYRDGEAADVTSTVFDVTGREPYTFAQFAKDYAHDFQSKSAGA
jgi:uncharacterized protein YbjT (DUF2867 family)